MSFNNDKIFVIITVAHELDASSLAHSLPYSRAVHDSHPCRGALYLIQKTLVATVQLIEGYRLANVTTLI